MAVERQLRDEFPSWYGVYPRHDDRAKALAAFVRARKAGASLAALTSGARRYRDDPNRDPGFTKYPATWLNSESWLNGPLPPRGGKPAAPVDHSPNWTGTGR